MSELYMNLTSKGCILDKQHGIGCSRLTADILMTISERVCQVLDMYDKERAVFFRKLKSSGNSGLIFDLIQFIDRVVNETCLERPLF